MAGEQILTEQERPI